MRYGLAIALLVGVAVGWRPALVGFLVWQAIEVERIRRELFARQEDAVLARLREYWRSLSGE